MGSALVLAVGGGAVALIRPGLTKSRLSPQAREIVRHVGAAILEGSLPVVAPSRETALQSLLLRVDELISALPVHAQAELSQLLALLGTGAGRRILAGLYIEWTAATIVQVQDALQSMRTSPLSLRQQAYHALHDIVGGAYFSDASTWQLLGYPGPLRI